MLAQVTTRMSLIIFDTVCVYAISIDAVIDRIV